MAELEDHDGLDGLTSSSEASDYPQSTSEQTPSGPESSSSSAAAARGTTSAAAEDGHQHQPKVRRRPIPRKGHTKSRNGCYNCKRRKVKCQENLPECYHCRRIGLICEYPPVPGSSGQQARQLAGGAGSESATGALVPGPTNALRSTLTVFSMEDMHFFQHFLLAAYPSLPIGGAEVWKEVAQLAHSVRRPSTQA